MLLLGVLVLVLRMKFLVVLIWLLVNIIDGLLSMILVCFMVLLRWKIEVCLKNDSVGMLYSGEFISCMVLNGVLLLLGKLVILMLVLVWLLVDLGYRFGVIFNRLVVFLGLVILICLVVVVVIE